MKQLFFSRALGAKHLASGFKGFKYLALAVILILGILTGAIAQAPAIQWQKSLGGSAFDNAYSVQQTTDGGYIVAGYSKSNNDGDVSGNHGNFDYWIVKLDNTGAIQWQKSLGGSSDDQAMSIQQTTDGGYIVAGISRSNDGDVSGNHGGDGDYWVVKLDNTGAIQWQKSLGGSGDDWAYSVQQTTDGGYIVAGVSNSNDGDVIDNHDNNADYWIVKLDNTGAIQWQESLGGSGYDGAQSIQQTTDGGYIVAGYSSSNNGNVSGNHGSDDYWIVKLNNTGAIQWQESLGGSGDDEAYSIQQTTDGGYIVAGYSWSNDGNVSGNHGIDDYWIVKLNNTGDIQWQKSLGGSSFEWANSIQQTTDGGYIVAGESSSNNGDVTGNHGGNDYWVVKLDNTGAMQWQKSLGSSAYDEEAYSIQQTTDGGYIVVGNSGSNDGDVTGNHGNADFWVVKLAPATTPDASGIVYVNKNAPPTSSGTGNSWANAVTEFANALAAAKTNTNIKQIWVAAGTYYPLYSAQDSYFSTTADPDLRNKAFVLVNNVQLYGGFAGDENTIGTRHGGASVLSGDIGAANNAADNAYHVVVSVGNVSSAILDGFTVSGGNANGNNSITVNGIDGAIQYYGGGIADEYSSPAISNCIISNNKASNSGGIDMYSSSSNITNCAFTGNTADVGGGAYIKSSSPVITNCTIAGNTASSGGGIENDASASNLANCIIYNNGDNDIDDDGSLGISYSLVQGGFTGGTKVTDADPLFTDPTNGIYTLQPGSPAIGTGSEDAYTNAGGNLATDKDLAGNPRLFGNNIDMGAYEFQASQLPVTGLKLTELVQENNNVSLKWSAVTEINDKNFTIQRSADNGNAWANINTQATKAPNGNSAMPLSYAYTDAGVPSGTYLYRIMETDIAGSIQNSNTVQVEITGNSIKIYPNPASSVLTVAGVPTNTLYKLININGATVQQGTISNNGQISVSSIAPGIYLLQITINNVVQTYKVQVQH
ncbi:MAG: T9SS type A sorting domain-containing protein [Chitinophagaceae bacterium]|jgi:hypothetical protein|nr:T9SS type A sorting domain-containing protein [Chitinophagaceae bacterium]